MNQKQLFNNNSLSHLIAEKITNQIFSGELRPGEKIVESNYAEEFGTSRAPIREALYLLATDGLIERIPRKGAVVKGYSESDIYDLLEIRMVLEGLAIKRIKIHGVNTSILTKMVNLIPEMEKVKDDHEKYASLNREFHMYIIEMSKSEIIKEMYRRLGRPLLALQKISFHEEKDIRGSIEEHIVILELLKNGLFDQALAVLEKHNRAVITRIENKIIKQ
jgi:DNA-binding GntR family transcriptional regulator